jgi:hypothetical protein
MAKAQKVRASKQAYVSPGQASLPGFESPFDRHLSPDNRWVRLAAKIPWDNMVSVYQSQLRNQKTGAEGINPRVVIGSLIIKHICQLTDRETVLQIQENMYMQYFLGFSSFCDEEPFDASLFVEFRKRLGAEQINAINERILGLDNQAQRPAAEKERQEKDNDPPPQSIPTVAATENNARPQQEDILSSNEGELLIDATACPQDISYPTDLNLLSDAREKSEELIDVLFLSSGVDSKPRTYRQIARKKYLQTAQKRHLTKKEIRKAIKQQLAFLRRNINHIHRLLDLMGGAFALDHRQYRYLLIIQTLYEQQQYMFSKKTHIVEHRIVSIHQPHVRPILRGKANAKVEFGAKIEVSIMKGYAFLEELSWEAYNESTRLKNTVEKYRRRFGHYPKAVLADKIYCTRENRRYLKERCIQLKAKPLGRSAAVNHHVRPGERNPIEGKFGQAKAGYGMNRIKARLQHTSESWIASIILVLNLVKLIGQVPMSLIQAFLILFLKRTYFFSRP